MITKTRNKKYWLRLGGFAVLLILAAGTFATLRLSSLWAYSFVHTPKHPAEINPDYYGYENWEEVSFESPDGLTISAWFMPPAPDNQAVIIYVHGHTRNKSVYLSEAIMLNEGGFGALLLDLRNSGESEGDLTTFGLMEALDIQGAVDYLKTRPEIDPNRIGIMGTSMGGSTTILAASQIPELRSVVVQSTFTSLEDNINEVLTTMSGISFPPFFYLVRYYAEQEAGFDIDYVRPVDEIAKIAPRPLLIIHGEDDELLNVQNAYALFEAAREPKQLVIYPGVGHVGFLELVGGDYMDLLGEFFIETLLGDD